MHSRILRRRSRTSPPSPCHLPPQPHHDYPLWREAQPSIAPSARNRCFLPAGFRRANRRAARRGGCAAPLGAIDLLSRPRCTGTTTPQPVSLALPPRAWYNERVIKGGRIRPDTLTAESAAAPRSQSKTRCGRHPAFLKNRPETCIPAVCSLLFPPTKGEEQPTWPAKHEYRFCNYRKCHASVARRSPPSFPSQFCNTENAMSPWSGALTSNVYSSFATTENATPPWRQRRALTQLMSFAPTENATPPWRQRRALTQLMSFAPTENATPP